MSEIRRGSKAIQEAAESSKGGGDWRPFVPAIYWKDDKEEKYVLFLNEIEEIPLFDMISFIPTENGFFAEVVAKTDQFFGEKTDAFEDQKEASSVRRNIAVAVELEPVIEVIAGRRKPRGFEVKTVEYSRRVVDDDGELTDETEEVTAPAVGVITQSPNNFFNVISNFDANEAPISDTPLKITRIGKDTSTTYTVVGYDDQDVDLTNLVEFVDGISYLGDDLEDVVNAVDGLPDSEAASLIGTKLLDKRIEELLDEDRYQELLEGVTESMDIYGNKKKKGKGSKTTERKGRGSQRRTTREERVTREEVKEPVESTDPEPTEEVKEKPTRKARSKAKATKAASGKSTPQERMAALRERAKAKA